MQIGIICIGLIFVTRGRRGEGSGQSHTPVTQVTYPGRTPPHSRCRRAPKHVLLGTPIQKRMWNNKYKMRSTSAEKMRTGIENAPTDSKL